MQQAVKTESAPHRLTIGELLDWMVEDQLVTSEAAEDLKKERRYYRGALHPLVIIAEQKWRRPGAGGKLLALEPLPEGLAKRVGMEYFHIDPLKIDFAGVTEVMSSAYATRFRILRVGVSGKEAVIATAEPHVRDWEKELAPMIKRDIKRVIANPLDIERYQVEFYNLARSIKGANKNTTGASGLSNFEQLVELGKENKQFDANDAHIVRIVDWLWQYAFEQRASDIHVEPRREQGIVRFRIDGVLHQVYQIPPTVLNAMTSRIKILARMDVVEKRRPQDPDIIMVGEIRDLETAEMAVQSALTGHLVLSTLHTNDAPSAVTRLLELGVAPYLLNATLNGIMAQRLVRVLCTHCKQKVEFNRAEDHAAWDALVAPWKSNRPTHVYKAVGCLECRMTGFMGRIGVYEVLVFSSDLKTLVAAGADLNK